MPDLLGFKITVSANRQITVPDVTVNVRIVSSANQSVVHEDYSVTAINLWNYIGGLSAAKKREFAEAAVQWLINDRLAAING